MLTDPPWKVKVRKTIPNVNAIILQPRGHGKEEHHLPGEQLDAERPLMEGEGEKDFSQCECHHSTASF